MSEELLKPLLDRLAKNPENTVLRLAVVRKASEMDMQSRALSLVLDLDPQNVPSDDDRKLVAAVFRHAGLDDDAKAWAMNAKAAENVAPAVSEGSAPPLVESPEPSPVDAPSATQGRNLRVVGGTEDDGNGASVSLPEPEGRPISFQDVGGLEDVKRDIERRIIAPFKQSSLLSRFKKRAGGGVLLYGPPGCGKTLIARATAGECGFDFISVAIPEILDPLSGNAERRLSNVFQNARDKSPTILFFDEIDALGSKRTATSATHQAQLVSHFLAEIDGAQGRNSGVLLLAATNIPWSMDPAFLRPGRFDRLFFVPPPDRTAREAILKLELGDRPVASGLKLADLAAGSSGLSGADLAQIVEFAADAAIDATLEQNAEVPISQKMLDDAAKEVRSSVTDWLTTARNYALYSNESGRYDQILAFLKKHGQS